VIERRALHGAVVEAEAGRLDDVQSDAETGAQPDAGADVLGNVWLKKRETHSKALLRAARGLVAAQQCERFARSARNLRRSAAKPGRDVVSGGSLGYRRRRRPRFRVRSPRSTEV